jgi:hypothetical protein
MVRDQEREGLMLTYPARISLAVLTLGLMASPALCADPPPPAPAAAAPAPAPDYHPSLGDLMTMAVQPRHTKVGLAGKTRDWAYLTYESSELRNAFNRIARTIPTYNQSRTADLFAAQIMPSIDELVVAIKAKDGPRFDRAYSTLTENCNICHAATDHGYVVIRAPQTSPYADQDFRPAK